MEWRSRHEYHRRFHQWCLWWENDFHHSRFISILLGHVCRSGFRVGRCASLIDTHCSGSEKGIKSRFTKSTLCPRRPATLASFNTSACGVGAVTAHLTTLPNLTNLTNLSFRTNLSHVTDTIEREREHERNRICERDLLHGVDSPRQLDSGLAWHREVRQTSRLIFWHHRYRPEEKEPSVE